MGPLKPSILPSVGIAVHLMRKLEFPTLYSSKIQSSPHGLLDQSCAGSHTTLDVIPPHPRFGCFWAYSNTLPQGVELMVLPFVKSLFCPTLLSPNEFLVRTPLEASHLRPTFLRPHEGWGGVGCVTGVQKGLQMAPVF